MFFLPSFLWRYLERNLFGPVRPAALSVYTEGCRLMSVTLRAPPQEPAGTLTPHFSWFSTRPSVAWKQMGHHLRASRQESSLFKHAGKQHLRVHVCVHVCQRALYQILWWCRDHCKCVERERLWSHTWEISIGWRSSSHPLLVFLYQFLLLLLFHSTLACQ